MKKKLFLYSIFNVFFILASCGYTKDKLVIKNTTSHDLFCVLLAKNINKQSYFEVGIITTLKKNSYVSPIIHTTTHSISEEIKDETNDGNLYILFHSEDIKNYVYDNMANNMDNLMKNKKIKIYKYSLKKLDSLNWIIEYDVN